jgi:hypothetical protein
MARFALLGSVRARPRRDAPPGGAGGNLRLQPTLPGVVWAWQHYQSSGGTIVRQEEPIQYTVQFFPDGTVAIDADGQHATGTCTVAGSAIDLPIPGTATAGATADPGRGVTATTAHGRWEAP